MKTKLKRLIFAFYAISSIGSSFADPPGQTYFDSRVSHVPWQLHLDRYLSSWGSRHKFGAVFWRGEAVLVHNVGEMTPLDKFTLYRIDPVTFQSRSGASLNQSQLTVITPAAHYDPDPAFSFNAFLPLIQCEVFGDKLYVFCLYRNQIWCKIYTPPPGPGLDGGVWSKATLLSATNLPKTSTDQAPSQVDDMAVATAVVKQPDGSALPVLVLALAFNKDPLDNNRRCIRFFTSADGSNWTPGATQLIETAGAGGRFQSRCVDLDMTTIIDETGSMPVAFSACIRNDDGSSSADSRNKAWVGIYDGKTIGNVTDLREQFDDPTFTPFRMRLFWGTIAGSSAQFKGGDLPAARNVLQVFMVNNPGPGVDPALYRAEVFLGEPDYRSDSARKLNLLQLRGVPRGGGAEKLSPLLAVPTSAGGNEHVLKAFYQKFGKATFFSGFQFTQFGVDPQTRTFDYWPPVNYSDSVAPFDLIPVVRTLDNVNGLPRLQQYAVLIGANGDAPYAQSSFNSALVMTSDQLVPYGYTTKDETASEPIEELEQQVSRPVQLNDMEKDYKSWQLIGIITGTPPYADDLRQANGTPPVASDVVFSRSHELTLQTTSQTEKSTGFSAGFETSILKVEGSWKQSTLVSTDTSETISTTSDLNFKANPLLPNRGRMLFLVPTIRTQTYYQCGWNGEKISYRQSASEDLHPIAFVQTTIIAMDLQGVDYDMTNPNAADTPFAKGAMVFPPSTDLKGWARQPDWSYSNKGDYVRLVSDIGGLFAQYTDEEARSEFTIRSSNSTTTSTTVEIDASAGLYGLGVQYNAKNVHSIATTTTNVSSIGISLRPPTVNSVPSGFVKNWIVKPYVVQPARKRNSDTEYENPSFLPEAYRGKNQAPFLLTYAVTGIEYAKASALSARSAALTPQVEEADGGGFLEVPQSQEIGLGGTTTLSTAFDSTGPLSYQWYFNFEPISGAKEPTLTIKDMNFDKEGYYYVTVTDGAGETHFSSAAYVDVKALPQIYAQPASDSVETYSAKKFIVGATGADSYQWRINGVPVEGETSDSFILPVTSDDTSAPLTVDVVVSNAAGSVTSEPATLEVFEPVDLDDISAYVQLTDSGGASFAVPGDFSDETTFQWYIGDTKIGESSENTLDLSSIPDDWDGQMLSVLVVNEYGDWDSADIARITLIPPSLPEVTDLPKRVALRKKHTRRGEIVIARTQKSDAFHYQWYLGTKRLINGGGVHGATTHRIRLLDRDGDLRGVLRLRVKDAYGNRRSLASRRLR